MLSATQNLRALHLPVLRFSGREMWIGPTGPPPTEHRSTEVAARAALQSATADAQDLLLPAPFLRPGYRGRRSCLSSRSRLGGSCRGGQCLDLAGMHSPLHRMHVHLIPFVL